MILLSMVVLNSRDFQGKLWLPKNVPKNNFITILSQKTVHKCIGTTLQRLKIDSKSLKTRLEWSYQILKISKTTTFLSAGQPDSLPAVRPTSTRRTGPILSTTKTLASRNTDLLFEEDLTTVP